MRKRLFLCALTLVLLSNAVVLGKVAFNRAAILESLIFTEREMPSRYSYVKEDSAVVLQLRWRTPMRLQSDYYDGYSNSIEASDDLRRSLGFKELDCKEASYRNNDDEVEAWVLMEFDGQAYINDLSILESRWSEASAANKNSNEIKSLKMQLDRLREFDSRLYAIAVAAAPETLLNAVKDSEKQFVIKAVVADSKYCKNELFIKQLSVDNLYVPKTLLVNNAALPEKYYAHIAIGNLGEAWLEKIVIRELQ